MGKKYTEKTGGLLFSNLTKWERFKLWIKKDYGCYLFLMPAIIGFFVFTAYPVLSSLIYSMTDFNGIFYTKFGFDNYVQIFNFGPAGKAKEILGAFWLTFRWAIISIPLGMVLSFGVALLVQREIKGVAVVRLLYYMPTIIPGIAAAIVWKDIFNSEGGLVNQWLINLGLQPQMWFDSDGSAVWTLILTGVWGIGGNMIMWLAALRNVPPELYEAASLDGAGAIGKLFRITVPLCTPIIFYNLINAMIAALQSFDVYAISQEHLKFISVVIYTTAFGGSNQYGLACSIGWVLFVVIAALTLITFKTNGWVNYGDEA